jgi:tetratricopeptide (TPR) repeat protein
MKRLLFTAMLLLGLCDGRAVGVKSGKERLRELVVIPTIDLTSGYSLYPNRAGFVEDHLVPGEIARLQKESNEHPEDPERWLRLATLLDREGSTNEAHECYGRAEKAARKNSDARSNDGLAFTSLADALHHLGNNVEAESIYRRATLVSSNQWKCWAGLGAFLGDRAYNLLMPEGAEEQLAPMGLTMPPRADSQSPETLAVSEAMRKESEKCFDRAILLAPKEVDVFLARAEVQIEYNLIDYLSRYYRERQPQEPDDMARIYYGPVVVQNLQRAADLCPDDARIISLAAGYMMAGELASLKARRENDWKSLPEKSQDYVHKIANHLDVLSQDEDRSRAACALERLGFLRIMMQQANGAETALRRAVALEPVRQKAWETLLVAMVQSGATPEEMETVCESLLKNKNSARNHLLLAKVLMKQNKWDQAADHIKAAAKLEPNDMLVSLFEGVVAMKSGVDEEHLSIATRKMLRANDLLGKMAADSERATRWREFMLNGAILSGLLDKPTDAKEWVDSVLKEFPDDETAKDIRAAIQ